MVDALDGQPGIYSARFSGPNATDVSNNDKLLRLLAGRAEAERGAHFQCAVVLMRHANDPSPLVCQASWQGRILTQAQGSHGFGYDPLFFVPEQNCSAAQLPAQLKNQISHRGQAMAKLVNELIG